MSEASSTPVPLEPLLTAAAAQPLPDQAALCETSCLGSRFRAIIRARRDFLNDKFLDDAPPSTFGHHLEQFYESVVPLPLHAPALKRKAPTVRHGIAHLLRGRQPLAARLARCLDPAGPYAVPGIGPAFWSAIVQALDPTGAAPGWCQPVRLGYGRCRAAESWSANGYRQMETDYGRWLRLWPAATALHLDDLLARVGRMRGRELDVTAPTGDPLAALVRQQRSRTPLRGLIRQRGADLAEAQACLKAALATRSPSEAWAALAGALPLPDRTLALFDHGDAFLDWINRLIRTSDPGAGLRQLWHADPLPGLGVDWPVAALHLREPRACHPLDAVCRRGLAALDDAAPVSDLALNYALGCEAATALAERLRLHPFELPGVLAMAGERAEPTASTHGFAGFCADTFTFLDELRQHNRRDWLHGQRDRYRYAVRLPLVELCRALASRYVAPVLTGIHSWELETQARSGKAVSALVRNDFGQSVPYQTTFWIAFYRRAFGSKRDDAQFYIRLDASGLAYGVRVGREARRAGKTLRRNVQDHAETLFAALGRSGALNSFAFRHEGAAAIPLTSPGDLRAWATGKAVCAEATLPPDAPLLRSDALVGEILLAFDRLVPLYACAAEAEPGRWLQPPADTLADPPALREVFCAATFLPPAWLDRAEELLRLKRQLILQGVPGTGKTHVARALARLVAGGREDAVRLVQFHPSYAYEEFVEGIKPQAVDVGGRTEVAYPVEPGLLLRFAAEAEREPGKPFVLVIDEINRGNLPRIFGELLFLLEYRDQAIELPYSRRPFRLPGNLIVIGTMNAADRSVATLDRALRRRFSFLEMPPDGRVLAHYLERHPPSAGERWAGDVVQLLDAVNAKLLRDLGPGPQVGHSFFMLPDLTPERLRDVWQHQVVPLLGDYFVSQQQRVGEYALDKLLPKRGRSASEEVRS